MRFARSNPSSNDWSHGVLFLSFLIYVAVLVLIFALFEITANPAVRSRVRRSISAIVQPEYISSHLYQIQARAVELEEFTDSGGAIEPLGENLLLVTPRGRIALVHADGEVEYLPQRVPMNETALEDPTLPVGFRVSDILSSRRHARKIYVVRLPSILCRRVHRVSDLLYFATPGP